MFGLEKDKAGGRVLIADDEPQIRDLFEMIVSMSLPDVKLDKAANGLEAVRLFETHHHSVILMDLRMPEMDGLQAFHAIHAICERTRQKMPAVVFCTGFAPPDSIFSLIGGGEYHGLLRKPVRSDEITEMVKQKLAMVGSLA